jgi:penicillin V acylase-like amidase (Ntn superfamily)
MRKLLRFFSISFVSYIRLLIITIFITFFQKDVSACTAFVLKDSNNVVVGFSFDFHIGSHCIYVNKRNVERNRYLLLAEKPVKWISKYGSITYNLLGKDWPHSGMNEAGLVVQCLGAQDEGAKYPHPDDRIPIDESGWIQYQLDNSASVEDVIKNMQKIRISNRSLGETHFLICDKTGNAIIIDYVNGKTKTYTGDDLPYPITANDTYPHMLNFLKQHKGYGGNRELEFKPDASVIRFVYVANKIKEYTGQQEIVDYTFDILKNLRQPQDGTRYQTVYDMTNLSIYYNVSSDFGKIKAIHFKEFDFDCNTPALMTEIQSDKSGNIRNAFYNYDSRINKRVILNVIEKLLDYIPENVITDITKFTDMSNCLHSENLSTSNISLISDSNLRKLVAFLDDLSKSKISIKPNESNQTFTFKVKLNKKAPKKLSFALEVPQESSVVPGYHLFLTPNPIIIEKGEKSATVTATLISSHFESGIDEELVINLLSDEVMLDKKNQLVIHVNGGRR